MNLILEKSKYVKHYTYLDRLFDKVPEFQEYIYFISEFEFNYCEDERLQKNNFFISGKELYQVINGKQIQFIWAVLTAFKQKPNFTIKNIPFAEGNPRFWTGQPVPQIKEAEFEIVCFDSALTLFIGVNDNLGDAIKKFYPDIKDLDLVNRKR